MSSFVPTPPALSVSPSRLVQPACKRPRPVAPLCVAPPPPRPKTRLPPIPAPAEVAADPPPSHPPPSHPPPSHPPQSFEKTCAALRTLCTARGALGRGVRATLRAFHRRASFALSTANASPLPLPREPGASGEHSADAALYYCGTHYYYIEIGPAYVRATARPTAHPVSRYAVEFHAWPTLQLLLCWEEVCTTTARQRRAALRRLVPGARYGRHVFVRADGLSALLHVAEELIGDEDTDETDGSPAARENRWPSARSERLDDASAVALQPRDCASFAPLSARLTRVARCVPRQALLGSAPLRVVALVELRRRPAAGRSAVAADCPFSETHACPAHGCRRRSLVLWMNGDGLTGGAFCPVCERGCGAPGTMAADAVTSSAKSMVSAMEMIVAENAPASPAAPAPVQVTWRVHFLRNNLAALCVPLHRIRRPAYAERLAERVLARHWESGCGGNGTNAGVDGVGPT